MGLGDRFIARYRKQQGDVDVDSFKQQLFDRRHAFGRARNLDEEVRALDARPEPLGLLDRVLRRMGEVRGHLQAHVAVYAGGAIVDGPQDVTGLADVVGRKSFVDFGGRPAGRSLAGDAGVVVGAGRERFFEDFRVGRDPGQSLVRDAPGEFAVPDHVAAQTVDPAALSEGGKFSDAVHRRVLDFGDRRENLRDRHGAV
ncbi:MAG: hypothetical protein JO273_21105 [Methylobacteriaceae bacterium]|nr:hypothetical protein [Methylobacteriaceae bacterium]